MAVKAVLQGVGVTNVIAHANFGDDHSIKGFGRQGVKFYQFSGAFVTSGEVLVWYLSGARCRLAHAQLKPLPLTISCFSKIQIGFSFLVLAHPGSPGQRAIKRVCVCVCIYMVDCAFSALTLLVGRQEGHLAC